MAAFEKGDKVLYGYWHYLNAKSKTYIEKEAIIIREVKCKDFDIKNKGRFVIKCKGNKSETTVYRESLKHIENATN